MLPADTHVSVYSMYVYVYVWHMYESMMYLHVFEMCTASVCCPLLGFPKVAVSCYDERAEWRKWTKTLVIIFSQCLNSVHMYICTSMAKLNYTYVCEYTCILHVHAVHKSLICKVKFYLKNLHNVTGTLYSCTCIQLTFHRQREQRTH